MAARNHPDLNVIKYLTENCKLNIHAKDNYDNTALFHATNKNPNLGITKYFIEV